MYAEADQSIRPLGEGHLEEGHPLTVEVIPPTIKPLEAIGEGNLSGDEPLIVSAEASLREGMDHQQVVVEAPLPPPSSSAPKMAVSSNLQALLDQQSALADQHLKAKVAVQTAAEQERNLRPDVMEHERFLRARNASNTEATKPLVSVKIAEEVKPTLREYTEAELKGEENESEAARGERELALGSLRSAIDQMAGYVIHDDEERLSWLESDMTNRTERKVLPGIARAFVEFYVAEHRMLGLEKAREDWRHSMEMQEKATARLEANPLALDLIKEEAKMESEAREEYKKNEPEIIAASVNQLAAVFLRKEEFSGVGPVVQKAPEREALLKPILQQFVEAEVAAYNKGNFPRQWVQDVTNLLHGIRAGADSGSGSYTQENPPYATGQQLRAFFALSSNQTIYSTNFAPEFIARHLETINALKAIADATPTKRDLLLGRGRELRDSSSLETIAGRGKLQLEVGRPLVPLMWINNAEAKQQHAADVAEVQSKYEQTKVKALQAREAMLSRIVMEAQGSLAAEEGWEARVKAKQALYEGTEGRMKQLEDLSKKSGYELVEYAGQMAPDEVEVQEVLQEIKTARSEKEQIKKRALPLLFGKAEARVARDEEAEVKNKEINTLIEKLAGAVSTAYSKISVQAREMAGDTTYITRERYPQAEEGHRMRLEGWKAERDLWQRIQAEGK